MRTIATFMICLLACSYSTAGDFILNSRRISTADGLLGNTVYELLQDDEGFIWLATNNGLSRYDGYSTVNYTSLSAGGGPRIDARVGRIFHDRQRQQLWLSTATYQNACYDLRLGRFIDWTGTGRQYCNQNKLMLTSLGMVLYGMDTGATLSGVTDGHPWALYYNRQQGNMKSDEVLTVVEDSAHNVWLPTADGIYVIGADRPDHQPARLPSGGKGGIMAAATTGQATYFMYADGTVYGYDTGLKQVLPTGQDAVRIPAALGSPTKVNVSFTWQGRWLLFTPEGTYAMTLSDGTFNRPQELQVADGLNQGQCPGYHFVANNTGRLWLFPDTGHVASLHLIPNAAKVANKGWKFHVTRSTDGRLFIATYGNGLFVYSPDDGQLTHYSAEDAHPVISSNYLLCATTDHQGCVWLGSETGGAYRLSTVDEQTATYIMPQPNRQGGWENTVSSIAETAEGQYTIGTREGHIYSLQAGERRVTPAGEKNASITACTTDSRGCTWIGTWGDGLYIGGQHFHTADTAHYLPTNLIARIVADGRGRVYVATWNSGLLTMDEQTGRILDRQLTANINESRLNDLLLTADGTLWAATNDGIYRLKKKAAPEAYNTANGRFPNDEVLALCMDSHHTLWAGTSSSGIVKCTLAADGTIGETTVIGTRQGLANNNVQAIAADREGYVWAATEDGLSRINPVNNIVNSYRFATTLQGNAASSRALTLTADGHLLAGTYAGLLTVNPAALKTQNTELRMQGNTLLTDLRINGTSVYELGLLSHTMSRTSHITLSHDQNSLTLYFSNFEYDWHQQPAYQYYLEGIDHDWRDMTTSNHADYSELRPGRYTFHLRSLDATGQWNSETTLTITIRQPWWNTWWAWLVYLLLMAAVCWYVYRNWRERFRLHQQMKLDQQLMELRTNLFTSITHEFRTPLAIIQGAIDKLAENPASKAAMQTAQRGTNRLLRLVNMFMEFRKVNTGNMRLQVEQADIVGFVHDIFQDFWATAQQKNLQMTFLPSERRRVMLFDKQHVENIVYNLLSNAVKYTPERGSIVVRLRDEAECLSLSVADSGPGISPAQQERLFRPFMHGYVSQGGMGIGLYTAYETARVHKGSLTYQPSAELGGACFTLSLPADDSVYAPDDYKPQSAIATDTRAATTTQDSKFYELLREMQPEAYNDLTVVIIEDDPDMQQQISNEVGRYFKTVCFSNGQSALSDLPTQPSLILCDVMLPDINGYDIVKQLRANGDTARIPIIMLTALDDETHQIRAYKAGADDYMVKPCNFRLLIARAMQLIKWSQSAPATSPSAANPPAAQPLIEGEVDKRFMERLQHYTAKHIADSTLTIDQLAQLMSMGRTKFYGKVKELTGMSPNKYLQEARMERAAELLLQGELTVSEISYKIGIQDPSYFNKCFKAKYGVVPSKYGKH